MAVFSRRPESDMERKEVEREHLGDAGQVGGTP
jgi:hypothetical protein